MKLKDIPEVDVAWCAGLLVADGGIGKATCYQGGYSYSHIMIQIAMYDERAIKKFANTFSVNYYRFYLKRTKHYVYRVMIKSRKAEAILARMWPYLIGTDKEDQALKHAKELDVEKWITGEIKTRRPFTKRF